MSQVPRQAQLDATKVLLENANNSETRSQLAQDADLLIKISKNPALATYFMPEVEKNRQQNRQLDLEETRLIANKQITELQTVQTLMNYAIALGAKAQETDPMSEIVWQTSQRLYMAIQLDDKLSDKEKAGLVNCSDKYGVTLLYLASQNENLEDVEKILNEIPINERLNELKKAPTTSTICYITKKQPFLNFTVLTLASGSSLSPSNRLTQRLATSSSSSLFPSFKALEILIFQGAHKMTPISSPFSLTLAIS